MQRIEKSMEYPKSFSISEHWVVNVCLLGTKRTCQSNLGEQYIFI